MLTTFPCLVPQYPAFSLRSIYVMNIPLNGDLSSGYKKSQCMMCGKNPGLFSTEPVWYLGDFSMKTVSQIQILGVTFSNNNKFDKHVQQRSQKCRQSMYSLNSIGMCYPGLNTASKTYLYKSICFPTLIYGLNSINISNKCIQQLESTQGGIIKQACGLSKQSHHSKLLRALNIDNVKTCINNSTLSLYNRICSVVSPTRSLCVFMLSQYVASGSLIPGSLVDRVVKMGVSPSSIMVSKPKSSHDRNDSDGVVDSLRNLLLNENYIKPWCSEYLMVKLLTRSF